MDRQELIKTILLNVEEKVSTYDASHDIEHIKRVLRNTKLIAKGEQLTEHESYLVTLAAILHDIGDAKYTKTGLSDAKNEIHAILSKYPISNEDIVTIIQIVEGISFSNEITQTKGKKDNIPIDIENEKHRLRIIHMTNIVQDADRLDAMGAIGIARCFTFGGARHRPIYTTRELDTNARISIIQKETIIPQEYKEWSDSGIGHVCVKLLRLIKMLKTETGKIIAQDRQKIMEDFLTHFIHEVNDDIV